MVNVLLGLKQVLATAFRIIDSRHANVVGFTQHRKTWSSWVCVYTDSVYQCRRLVRSWWLVTFGDDLETLPSGQRHDDPVKEHMSFL